MDVDGITRVQAWEGSFVHAGGALSIVISHQVTGGSALIMNASSKAVVDYLGPE